MGLKYDYIRLHVKSRTAYKILTLVRAVSCMAAHVNQKIGASSTAISTTITAMRSLIGMLHTMSQYKMKSVTCIITCNEDTCKCGKFIHL